MSIFLYLIAFSDPETHNVHAYCNLFLAHSHFDQTCCCFPTFSMFGRMEHQNSSYDEFQCVKALVHRGAGGLKVQHNLRPTHLLWLHRNLMQMVRYAALHQDIFTAQFMLHTTYLSRPMRLLLLSHLMPCSWMVTLTILSQMSTLIITWAAPAREPCWMLSQRQQPFVWRLHQP